MLLTQAMPFPSVARKSSIRRTVYRLFGEDHDPIRRLKDRLHQARAAIDQNRTAGHSSEMRSGVETVKHVGIPLKQL